MEWLLSWLSQSALFQSGWKQHPYQAILVAPWDVGYTQRWCLDMVHLGSLGVVVVGGFRESFSSICNAWGLGISLYYHNTHKKIGLWNITIVL